jgi:hypothetical protein
MYGAVKVMVNNSSDRRMATLQSFVVRATERSHLTTSVLPASIAPFPIDHPVLLSFVVVERSAPTVLSILFS